MIAHSFERVNSDSEGKLRKWRYEKGSTVFIFTSANTEGDLFNEQKRLVT